MDWIAAALEDMHRVLKPTGALFLICDESVGLYIRLLLDELIGPRDVYNRMTWRKVSSGSGQHYVFLNHKSAEVGRHGQLYTVIRRHGIDNSSLVAFSFVQGRRVRRATALHAGDRCSFRTEQSGSSRSLLKGRALHADLQLSDDR